MPHNLPQCISVDAVESLLVVDKVNVNGRVSFQSDLLQDDP